MKINVFNSDSSLYPFRWLVVITIALVSWLTYADYTGWRILSFGSQQQWNASGPGGHK